MSTSIITPPTQQSSAVLEIAKGGEQQAIEVQMIAAKRFPRDEVRARDNIINACTSPSLAECAIYQYSKGGTNIQGASIHLAKAIAQRWGNCTFGWRILGTHKDASGVSVSVVEAYAWDMENNVKAPMTFEVKHWRDTRNGGYELKDEREIYELCANMAARRMRACILSVIPNDIVEDAMRQIDVTAAAQADVSPAGQKKLLEKFAEFGVSKAMIEKRIQRKLDAITPAQVLALRKIYTSLADGMSELKDWFEEVPLTQGEGENSVNPFKDKKPAPATPKAQTMTAAETANAPKVETKTQAATPSSPIGHIVSVEVDDTSGEYHVRISSAKGTGTAIAKTAEIGEKAMSLTGMACTTVVTKGKDERFYLESVSLVEEGGDLL